MAKKVRYIFKSALVTGLVLLPLFTSIADDAAGVVGVRVASNETVSASVPFCALGASPVVLGTFAPSDSIVLHSLAGTSYASYVFGTDVWMSSDSGAATTIEAGFGDTVVFIPSDADGRDFYISGRIPGLASTNDFPRVESIFVSPSAGFAQFEIATDGTATDSPTTGSSPMAQTRLSQTRLLTLTATD